MTDKPKPKTTRPRRAASTVAKALGGTKKKPEPKKPDPSKGSHRSHGVWAKYFPEEVTEEAVRATLADDLIALRCGLRNGMVTMGRITRDLNLPDDEIDIEQRLDLYKLHVRTADATDKVIARIIQMEKTIAEIPYIVSRTQHTEILKDKDRAITERTRTELALMRKAGRQQQVVFNLTGFGVGRDDD